MRIGLVVGKVTLGQSIDEFESASLKLIQPLMLDRLVPFSSNAETKAIKKNSDLNKAVGVSQSESIVAWDRMGSSDGALVAIAEGPEASMPFRPEIKPVDAQVVAILDTVSIGKNHHS